MIFTPLGKQVLVSLCWMGIGCIFLGPTGGLALGALAFLIQETRKKKSE